MLIRSIILSLILIIPSLLSQTSVKVTDVGSFSDNRCAFRLNNKWGFIDTKGNIVVPPAYETGKGGVPKFYFNRAVLSKITPKGARWGAIDTTGWDAISFDYLGLSEFHDSLGFIYTPADAKNSKSKAHQSIIHISGLKLFEESPSDYDYQTYFKDGMARARVKGKYGFINYLGLFLVEPKYYEIEDFSEDLAAVRLNSNAKWGFVNKLGLVIVDYISEVKPTPFSCKRAVIGNFNRKYGVVTNEGRVLLEPTYEKIYQFVDNVSAVNSNSDTYSAIIDSDIKVIKKWEYDTDKDNYITIKSSLSEGLFVARKFGGQKMGYLDKTGKVIIPFIYDYALPFSCGLAEVSFTDSKTNKTEWGFIDKTGKMIIKLEKVN